MVRLKGALQAAGEEVIPRIPEQHKCYISDKTWDLINQRKTINDSLYNASNQDEYHKKECEVKK